MKKEDIVYEVYHCKECGKKTKAPAEKFSMWIRCECGGQASCGTLTATIYNIPGYNVPGYNEGLGVNIKSKSHLDSVLKERDLKEAA